MVGIREALAQAQGPGQGLGLAQGLGSGMTQGQGPGLAQGLTQGPGLGGEGSMDGMSSSFTSTSTWTPASLQAALGPSAFRLTEYTQALDLLTNASAALM